MVKVAYLPYRGTAVKSHFSYFSGRKSYLSYAVFLCHELCGSTGCADKLRTLAGVKLNVIDIGTDGDIRDGQNVARFYIGALAGIQNISDAYADRSYDIALLAVLVTQKRYVCRHVGIVFDAEHRRRAGTEPAEINDTVFLLVTAASVTYGYAAEIVTAGLLLLDCKQRLLRRLLGDLVKSRNRHMSSRRSCRLI